jgi:transcriptional regulator with XRE-family HTH domain
MAKIMVTPRPSVLKKFLEAEGKTFEEVAAALQMSRATLRRINDGKPVKDETLRNVADHLRKPVSHFLCERPQVVSSDQSGDKLLVERTIGSVTMASILLRRLDGEQFRYLANLRSAIEWSLSVSKLSPRAAEILRTLESLLVEKPKKCDSNEIVIGIPGGDNFEIVISNHVVHSGRNSLSRLIEQAEKVHNFEECLKGLTEEGVFLLGSEFLYWNCRTEEAWVSGDETKKVEIYTSEYRYKIVVQGSNVSTIRASVVIGTPPPTTVPENGHMVRVDGEDLTGEFDISDYTPVPF